MSFNKVFAKLGSDYKKPDAVTVIDKDNFKEIVWPLDCGELLYVGRRTKEKLRDRGILTIGDLANTSPEKLKRFLGKNGEMLYIYANGYDTTPVQKFDYSREIKSVGASTTTPRDLYTLGDVRAVVFSLSEEVGERLREKGLEGNLIALSVRDKYLNWCEKQRYLDRYTNLSSEIAAEPWGFLGQVRPQRTFKEHRRSDRQCKKRARARCSSAFSAMRQGGRKGEGLSLQQTR